MKAILNDIRNIKSGKKELRGFGLTIGAILVILGLAALWRGKASGPYFLAPGAGLVMLGLFFPAALAPLQKAWMAFSVVIGFFMSRLILAVLFYAVVTPIGLLLRISGRDVLDERIDRSRASYWIIRPAGSRDKKSYENQF